MLFLSVRGTRPGKNVQLTESEIRGLCLKSRELFLSQPILLELEAPLKICGMYQWMLAMRFTFKTIRSYAKSSDDFHIRLMLVYQCHSANVLTLQPEFSTWRLIWCPTCTGDSSYAKYHINTKIRTNKNVLYNLFWIIVLKTLKVT